MARIEWDPSLETGDALVDAQHRNIHELFNDLEAADDDPAEIMAVLDRLMAHVDTHFATEEDLMRRKSYPPQDEEPHVAEHRELTDGARGIVLKFRSGEVTAAAPVVEFLRKWLVEHVHERDRLLVEYVRARGGAAKLPGE